MTKTQKIILAINDNTYMTTMWMAKKLISIATKNYKDKPGAQYVIVAIKQKNVVEMLKYEFDTKAAMQDMIDEFKKQGFLVYSVAKDK